MLIHSLKTPDLEELRNSFFYVLHLHEATRLESEVFLLAFAIHESGIEIGNHRIQGNLLSHLLSLACCTYPRDIGLQCYMNLQHSVCHFMVSLSENLLWSSQLL